MSLIVDDAHHASWVQLAAGVRRYLVAYLAAGTPVAATWPPVIGPRAPAVNDQFLVDLGRGGAELRAAFPRLERRLAEVGLAPITVRVACEGVHEGPFYGVLGPTGRTVRFDEIHHLQVDGESVVTDTVEIDLAAILRQLGPTPSGG